MFYKTTLLFSALITPFSLYAQENKVVLTDSSQIETRYFEAYNYILITNTLNKGGITHYRELYYDSKKLKETGMYLNGDHYGLQKEFDQNGKVISLIDHTKGEILHRDETAYPFSNYQNKIKQKGDSILKNTYSEPFIKKHIVWDIDHSFMNGDNETNSWSEKVRSKPISFLLRYIIIYNGVRYPDLVELELNSAGKLIRKKSAMGVESRRPGYPKDFRLSPHSALLFAKKKGLVETPKNKAFLTLVWETQPESGKLANGLRVYACIKTAKIEDIQPEGRSTVVEKFDVYVFDPWIGNFIEKKKMKTITGWEFGSGSSSGFILDK